MVKTSDGVTPSVDITQGVLQGEVLSPLLFAILLHDLEEFFVKINSRGIFINQFTEVNVLAYADDLIILADSP